MAEPRPRLADWRKSCCACRKRHRPGLVEQRASHYVSRKAN
jgi:hypothetical protein